MSGALTYSILQQKKRVLGFETYVAPDNFDRKAQPVDIYDVFERYYRNHQSAKYIYSVLNTVTAFNLTGGTSYRYGYENGGISYVIDPLITLVRSYFSGYVTSIPVNDTSGFPSSGIISVNGSSFTYTSITSNTFVGISQNIGIHNVGESISSQITWIGTKRWVIVSHTTTSSMIVYVPTGTEWFYGGNLVKCVSASRGTLKYIHIHKLSNITTYSAGNGNNVNLTGTLYISGSASVIASQAFIQCTGISKLIINEGVQRIEINAFRGCTGIKGELIIPNSVTDIGSYTSGSYSSGAFINCNGLTSLVLGNSVSIIGPSAFHGCYGLTGTLTIPNSMVTIQSYAFRACSNLTSLDLGTGVQILEFNAFESCTKLSGSLIFPESLTTIGSRAFYGCTAYTGTLTVTSGITSIGQAAFGDDNFTDIDVTANAGYEDVDNVLYEISTRTALHSIKSNTGTITFQNNTLIIGAYCCYRNLRTGTLTIPDSVTIIGGVAFQSCAGFTSLIFETITSSLTSIGDGAFNSCNNIIGTVTIPNSVTSIANTAFRFFGNNVNLILGSGLTSIPYYGFAQSRLASIIFGANITSIGERAFWSIGTISENLIIPNSVETIGIYAFADNTARTGTLTLGTGLKTIGGQAFGNVPFTGTLAIPSLVTVIGEGAFQNNNFSAISSAASGFTVSDYVLYDETVSGQIKAHTSARGYAGTLTLKTGTTSILIYCFYNNTNRSGTLTLLSTITNINTSGFQGCTAFNRVDSYPATAPTVVSGGLTLGGTARPLHIPTGGGTGYGVAPWTTATIFTQPPVADL